MQRCNGSNKDWRIQRDGRKRTGAARLVSRVQHIPALQLKAKPTDLYSVLVWSRYFAKYLYALFNLR
jgi:hypothetical protein